MCVGGLEAHSFLHLPPFLESTVVDARAIESLTHAITHGDHAMATVADDVGVELCSRRASWTHSGERLSRAPRFLSFTQLSTPSSTIPLVSLEHGYEAVLFFCAQHSRLSFPCGT